MLAIAGRMAAKRSENAAWRADRATDGDDDGMQLHHAGWHVEAWSRMVAMKLGALRALKLGALRGGDEARARHARRCRVRRALR